MRAELPFVTRAGLGLAMGCGILTLCCWSGGCGFRADDPDLSFFRGLHAFEEGRWDWARIYFEDDLARNPDRDISRRHLGIAWVSGLGGGLQQGTAELEKYLEKQPDDVAIRRRMISILLGVGDRPAAMEAATLLDDGAPSLVLKGRLLIESDPLGALELFDAALESDPELATANALAAVIHEQLGDFTAATRHAARAVEIDPFSHKTVAQLVRLAQIRGDREEADRLITTLEIVSRLYQSRDADTLAPSEELGLVLELESSTGASGLIFMRRKAELLLEVGRVQEGMSVLNAIRSLPGFGTNDRLLFARLVAQAGQLPAAHGLYAEVNDHHPENTVALASLALLELRMGRASSALAILTAAQEASPHAARLHAARAAVELRLGSVDDAVASYERALWLAPWEARWRLALADIFRSRGDTRSVERLLADAPEAPRNLADYGRRYGGPAYVSQTGDEAVPEATPSRATETGDDVEGWFVDVSEEAGLDFVQYDGRSGQRFYVETTGSGGGWLDYDDDGDLDLYLLTGAPTPGSPELAELPRNALLENRDGRFVDVAHEAGVDDDAFGMGMCVGDADGDGLLDLMVTNYGPDRLYRNLGNGRFQDVAVAAGVADPRWSSNCAFGDLDGDGDLDLYVTHYLDFNFTDNPFCGDRARGLSAYCRPSAFDGVTDSLFLNRGDGTFREMGASRGIAQGTLEKGFGVVMSDLDDDNDLDIFVANDSTPNRLYVNDGGGFFKDHALVGGLALNHDGMPTSGMGVGIGDVDGDIDTDLMLTNYSMESNNLYRHIDTLRFTDDSKSCGITATSTIQVGWGVQLFDVDNDGDLDVAVANGHVVDNIALFEPGVPYAQRNRLLENDGTGRFEDVSDFAGSPFRVRRVSRALAQGDWNSDGRIDLLVANCNDRFDLLENRHPADGHWVGLRLVGAENNRSAIGARVTLTAGELTMRREVRSGGSFQAQSDLRLHFGLGDHPGPVTVEVRWPDGVLRTETIGEIDRYHEVHYTP